MEALEVLQAIARSGAAMSALSDPSCAVVGAEPPETNPDGTLLMVNADGDVLAWPIPDGTDIADYHPRNPGHPTLMLADWVRDLTEEA
jgi:hypothetical protein